MAGTGVNKAIADAAGATKLTPGLFGGLVQGFVDTYVGTTAESGATLTVEVGPELPVGAVIVGVAIQCPATGITIDVGDTDDTDRYISAAAASQASYIDNVTAGLGYIIDGDDDQQVLLTLSGSCAAVEVRIAVLYMVK